MARPSTTRCGSDSRIRRSMKAPGSPSSALHTTYFGPGRPWASAHLTAVGKPAPPRPRRLEASMVSMTSCGTAPLQAVAQRPVAVAGEVVFDAQRIDDAAVLQHDTRRTTILACPRRRRSAGAGSAVIPAPTGPSSRGKPAGPGEQPSRAHVTPYDIPATRSGVTCVYTERFPPFPSTTSRSGSR